MSEYISIKQEVEKTLKENNLDIIIDGLVNENEALIIDSIYLSIYKTIISILTERNVGENVIREMELKLEEMKIMSVNNFINQK